VSQCCRRSSGRGEAGPALFPDESFTASPVPREGLRGARRRLEDLPGKGGIHLEEPPGLASGDVQVAGPHPLVKARLSPRTGSLFAPPSRSGGWRRKRISGSTSIRMVRSGVGIRRAGYLVIMPSQPRACPCRRRWRHGSGRRSPGASLDGGSTFSVTSWKRRQVQEEFRLRRRRGPRVQEDATEFGPEQGPPGSR